MDVFPGGGFWFSCVYIYPLFIKAVLHVGCAMGGGKSSLWDG